MMRFFEMLQNSFDRFPDKDAVIYSGDDSRFTYRELDEFSGRIAAWLKAKGAGREDNVLLKLPRGILIPAAMIGVWKNGSACIVCESTMAPERIRYILSDSSASIAITEEDLPEISETEPVCGLPEVDPHDSAFVVYTSGTTGNPKGVIHEYGNMDEILAAKRYQGETLCRETDILAYNELIRPFRMVGTPLYRFRIFETEDYDYIFMDFHHILSDGTSYQVILQNFSDAYHGRELPRDYMYLYLRDANKRRFGRNAEHARRWAAGAAQERWRTFRSWKAMTGSTPSV